MQNLEKTLKVKVIFPIIKKLKEKDKCKGASNSDTLFINEYKKYNVIVGMFHDQVLAPFKSIFKFNAINITIGLDYLQSFLLIMELLRISLEK